jgi:hypothetical protein
MNLKNRLTRPRLHVVDSIVRPETGYRIDVPKACVLVRFAARLTFREIYEYALRLRGDPLFSPSFAEIVDLREVEEILLTPAELTKLADEVDPFDPKSKRAFVVKTQEQIHAAKLHGMLRIQDNIRVFFSIGEAEDWIVGAET